MYNLRGIFDGGGVRKQNGHWQSSGNEKPTNLCFFKYRTYNGYYCYRLCHTNNHIMGSPTVMQSFLSLSEVSPHYVVVNNKDIDIETKCNVKFTNKFFNALMDCANTVTNLGNNFDTVADALGVSFWNNDMKQGYLNDAAYLIANNKVNMTSSRLYPSNTDIIVDLGGRYPTTLTTNNLVDYKVIISANGDGSLFGSFDDTTNRFIASANLAKTGNIVFACRHGAPQTIWGFEFYRELVNTVNIGSETIEDIVASSEFTINEHIEIVDPPSLQNEIKFDTENHRPTAFGLGDSMFRVSDLETDAYYRKCGLFCTTNGAYIITANDYGDFINYLLLTHERSVSITTRPNTCS